MINYKCSISVHKIFTKCRLIIDFALTVIEE